MLAADLSVQEAQQIGDRLREFVDVHRWAGIDEGHRGPLIASGSAADPELDSARVEGIEHTKLLRHLESRVVREHDAAASHFD